MELCEGCKQPDHCSGVYPSDDPHKAGRVRGCFREKASTVSTDFALGASSTRVMKGRPARANPAWERGVVGETRPGGGFVPVISDNGAKLGVKEYSDNKRRIDKRLREVRRGERLPGATPTDSKG